MRRIVQLCALATMLLGCASGCKRRSSSSDDDAAGMMGCPGMGMRGPMGPGHMRGMRGMPQLMSWMNGAELDGRPTQPRPTEEDALRSLGARLFADRCVVCHGEKGAGDGREAARLSIPPRDFTTGVFKLRSTPTGSLPTDEDLFRTISRGVHGTGMVPWVTLSEQKRWALVAHVKTLSPDFSEAEEPPTSIAVPPAPSETSELAERGRGIYERAKCADCHGASGRGDGPAAKTLTDEASRPIRPRAFSDGRFRRGTRMEDIYLTLRTGLDGTPMGSYAKALTPDETWAVAAHVRTFVPKKQAGPDGMTCPMMGGNTDSEEHLGMMICMPGMPRGMPGMPMMRGR